MSFSILPKELIITIFTYVDYEIINNLDLHTSTKLFLTEINNKELQLDFINNYSFIEYKNNLINPQYIFDKFFEIRYSWHFKCLSEKKIKYLKKIISKSDPSVNDNMAIKAACRNNNVELIKILLENNKVNPTAENNFAIKHAYDYNYTKIIKLLLNDPRVSKSYPKWSDYDGHIMGIAYYRRY